MYVVSAEPWRLLSLPEYASILVRNSGRDNVTARQSVIWLCQSHKFVWQPLIYTTYFIEIGAPGEIDSQLKLVTPAGHRWRLSSRFALLGSNSRPPGS